MFQRRAIALVEDDDSTLVAVASWQDIVRIDLDGIWVEELAVATTHQHSDTGTTAYELATDHLRTIDRDGDHLAALVHVSNTRSKRLLSTVGWQKTTDGDGDHELWFGRL